MKFSIIKNINQQEVKRLEKKGGIVITILFTVINIFPFLPWDTINLVLSDGIILSLFLVYFLALIGSLVYFTSFRTSQRIKTYEVLNDFLIEDTSLYLDGKCLSPSEFKLEIYDYKGRWLSKYGPASDGTNNKLTTLMDDKEVEYQFLISSSYEYAWTRRKIQYLEKKSNRYHHKYTLFVE